MCFPVNFDNFLRTSLFIEYLWWLFLKDWLLNDFAVCLSYIGYSKGKRVGELLVFPNHNIDLSRKYYKQDICLQHET